MGKLLTPSSEPAGQAQDIGQQLRQAREASHLSITSVAASLRFPARVVEALEDGDFKQFEPVYARGYLRNYARLLNLPAEPLVEAYNRCLAAEHPPAQAQPQELPVEVSPWKLYLLVAAVGLPLVLWSLGKVFLPSKEAVPPPLEVESAPAKTPDSAAAPPQQDAAADQAKVGEASAPAEAAAKAEPSPAVDAGKPAATTEPLPSAPAGTTAPPTQALAAPPAAKPAEAAVPTASQTVGQGPDNITLRLSASGWVSVRDQAGQRLVYENLPAGTERTYAGQAPFTVVLGNAPAVKIDFNGQPYELPKIKAGTVARFKLGGVVKPSR